MSTKAAEKITNGLTEALEGFTELEALVHEDIVSGLQASGKKSAKSARDEVAAAIVLEVKTIIESIIENESSTPEDIGTFISALTESIEEIDPSIFEDEDTDDDDTDDEDDDDDDLDDEDEDDEDDLDDDDDEELED